MILHRKYPFKESTWKEQLLYAFIVFLILYLLRPFGLSVVKGALLLPCFVSGLITFLVELIHAAVTRQIVKHKQKWTILDAGIAAVLLIVFIGVGNFTFWALYFGADLMNISLFLRYCPIKVCKLQSSYICSELKNQRKNNEAYKRTKIGINF